MCILWLFQHYERDANGLCTQLRKPVAKQGNFDICVNPDEFVKEGWSIKTKDIKMLEVIGSGDFGGEPGQTFTCALMNSSKPCNTC